MQALTFLSLKNAGRNRVVTLADSGDNAGHPPPEPESGSEDSAVGLFHAALGGGWAGGRAV